MTDRYNPLVHEVNATVRMGAHPDGGYVLATEHEKTEAELATVTGAYLRVEGELVGARKFYLDERAKFAESLREHRSGEEFARMVKWLNKALAERNAFHDALRTIASVACAIPHFCGPTQRCVTCVARSALETKGEHG